MPLLTTSASPKTPPVGPADLPLFVDLDGTLIRGDLLWESAALFVRRAPWSAWRLPWWLLEGKAGLKRALAERVLPDVTTLPYRADVLALLTAEHERGRRVILATASHQRLAEAVAQHLGVFDAVLATEGETNLAGINKLEAIQKYLQAQGWANSFDYIGDSAADVPICRAARHSYLVNPDQGMKARVGSSFEESRRLGEPNQRLRAWVRALRPQQWAKNVLVFVPLLTSHKFVQPGAWLTVLHVCLGFMAFNLCASAVYLLNDLLDIDADRQHPRKRLRPLASGRLSIPAGVISCGLLMTAGMVLGISTGLPHFVLALGLYVLMTSLYSFWLKRKLLLDVIVLAGLYTLRIEAGGAAAQVQVSQWLLAFSMFLFLSLAFLKRYSELLIMQDRFQRDSRGRSYITDDLALLENFGPTSGYLSVLVFCLYINTDVARELHRHPEFLWAVCPILLYWVTRLWLLARRRHFADDPIAFAMRDRVSILAGIAAVVAVLLATML